MPKQKQMKTSMTGPRLRAEIEAMIPLSTEGREARMKKLNNFKLALLNEAIDMLNKKEIDLEKVTEAILWEMTDGKLWIEIKGRK
jgi:uncharacterized metal-binding protein YceD (DUF177 family)